MDVFGFALSAGGDVLRDAAIDAGYELGVFSAVKHWPRSLDELVEHANLRGRHRLRALLDVLVALGAIGRVGEAYVPGAPPPRPNVPRSGWGFMAEVIRSDKPLDVEGGEIERRYHRHLLVAGARPAAELAERLATGPLAHACRDVLDLGCGAGAYAKAFLERDPEVLATLVDFADVIELARTELAAFHDRITFVGSEAGSAHAGNHHGVAVLANVLHLHGVETCERLVRAAADRIAPGGAAVIKDLRLDHERTEPFESLMFALNMAIYTGAGDVYPVPQLRAWLADAGLVAIEELRLATAPEAIVVIGYKPRGATAALRAVTGHDKDADQIGRELDGALAATHRDLATSTGSAVPLVLATPIRTVLTHAIAYVRANGGNPAVTDMVRHYTDTMPRQRAAQLDGTDASAGILHASLDWSRLPRLSAAIDEIVIALRDAGASVEQALGASSAPAFRASTPTIAALYERTHYGGFMPLLYGNLADLVYFAARQAEHGWDLHQMIDRYLTTPLVHELCHFAPARDALQPLHLDECVAGWLGVHVHREFAYPADGHDDGIFAAPWLSQVGQAIARAFGIRNVIRAHAGAALWDVALPKPFVDAAARLGWEDWTRRRTLHFLSNTLDPAPWVALALACGAGRSLDAETLVSLAQTPLRSFAALPDDPVFDRAIVRDALDAMCLDNFRIEGSFRARMTLPGAPIEIDAETGWVTTARRGEVDIVPARYWIPPAVAARIVAAGHAGYSLHLRALASVREVAELVCAAASTVKSDGFDLITR